MKQVETNLYFVRHGETDYNRERIVQGRGIDVPLNDVGKGQARAVAKRLKKLDIDAVYSSTLMRAQQTARIANEALGFLSHKSLKDLEEMSWGIYEGKGQSPVLREAFDKMLSEWRDGIFDQPIEGGESILDVEARGLRAMDYILQKHPGQSVLIVSHGRFLRVLIASLLPEYGLLRMHDLEQANTAFNHLIFSEGRYQAKTLSSVTHLTNNYAQSGSIGSQ